MFIKLFICLLSFLLPVSGLAETAGSAPSPFHGQIYAQCSLPGEQTEGITFTVHDVYYDGYQLTLSITQAPNSAGYMVYNDVLGDYEIDPVEEGIGNAIPLGAYCETTVFGKEGKALPMTGMGQRNGAAYVRTDSYRFLPGEAPDELHVLVTCGVMETPGHVVGEFQTLDLALPIQAEVKTRRVVIADNEGKPPYLDEIFIAETEEIAEIFAFYSRNASGECKCPIVFVNAEDEELEPTSYANDNGDPGNHRGYTYQAIRKSGPLHSLCVLDLHSKEAYVIDLEDGTVQKESFCP